MLHGGAQPDLAVRHDALILGGVLGDLEPQQARLSQLPRTVTHSRAAEREPAVVRPIAESDVIQRLAQQGCGRALEDLQEELDGLSWLDVLESYVKMSLIDGADVLICPRLDAELRQKWDGPRTLGGRGLFSRTKGSQMKEAESLRGCGKEIHLTGRGLVDATERLHGGGVGLIGDACSIRRLPQRASNEHIGQIGRVAAVSKISVEQEPAKTSA